MRRPGSKIELAVEPARRALDHGGVGVGIGRRLVVLAVGNAKAAAEIDMLDAMAVGAQEADEFREQRERFAERIELDDLAADVHVDADDADAVELGGARIDLAGATDRNTEFVLGLPRRDFLVRLGIDIGIDADRDIGAAVLAGGDRGEQLEFGLGFDVDAENALLDRERQFFRGLADTGKHDLFRRDAGFACAQKFAGGDHIGAGAEPRERGDHGLVGVRLHRVADERVDIGEGAREYAVVPLDSRARIAVEGRADGVRHSRQLDGLGVQRAVQIGEVMHGLFRA